MSKLTIKQQLQLAGYYYFDKIRNFRDLKLSNPKAWNVLLWNLYGIGKTQSGIQVNEVTAQNLSSVYAAIGIIAGDISTLPIHLFQKKSNGGRKVITSHSSLERLNSKANDLIPAMNFRECAMGHILAWGNLYAEKVYNDQGQIVELWPITPDRVTPIWEDGDIWYKIKVGNEDRYFKRDRILHIAGLGYDGLVGYSVIFKAAESIGLSLGAEKFGARYFGANTNLGGVMKVPSSVRVGSDAYKNIKESMKDYQGSDKSHRWMLLEHGMEIEKLGFNMDESQFLQTRQFQVSEIARWFNIPPHKLKDLTRSTFSNIEEQEIEYVVGCLSNWVARLEQNYNLQLLTEKERLSGYYFKHNLAGLLRGNMQARSDFYTRLFYLGALTPNEIRAFEDMEKLKTANADKTYIQVNLVPLDEIDSLTNTQGGDANTPINQQDNEPEQNSIEWARGKVKMLEYRNIAARDKISQRYHPLVMNSAGLVIWREKILIQKLLRGKKSLRDKAGNLISDIEQMYATFHSHVDQKMFPVFRALADSIYNQALLEIGESVDELPDEVLEEIKRFSVVYASRHISSSSGQIISIIKNTDAEAIPNAIEERLAEWDEKRPLKIANNETNRLSNFMAQSAFFAYAYKSYWRIRGSHTCPYCVSLNGRAIKQGQSYFKGGEEHEPQGAENGPMLIRSTVMHPPLHQGCDCYISVR